MVLLIKAWGPLVRGMRFRHPKIVALAEKYNKEPAQVLLRYSLQKVRARHFPPIATALVHAAIDDMDTHKPCSRGMSPSPSQPPDRGSSQIFEFSTLSLLVRKSRN